MSIETYRKHNGKYGFNGKTTVGDLLPIIDLAAAADADGKALYWLQRHVGGLKLKAKDKLAIGGPLAEALFANLAKERALMLAALDEVLRMHKALALEHVDAFLAALLAGPERNVGLAPLFALCLKAAEDPEAMAGTFAAVLSGGSLHKSVGGQKFAERVHAFYAERGIEPPDRSVFSPFPVETTVAMAALAPLPWISLKRKDKLVFRVPPAGDKTKEMAPSYKTRFLMAWMKGIPEGRRWKWSFFDEPTTISFTRGENYLFKNKGHVGVGWVEPYQYELVVEQKSGQLGMVDHETMELQWGASVETFLEATTS